MVFFFTDVIRRGRKGVGDNDGDDNGVVGIALCYARTNHCHLVLNYAAESLSVKHGTATYVARIFFLRQNVLVASLFV